MTMQLKYKSLLLLATIFISVYLSGCKKNNTETLENTEFSELIDTLKKHDLSYGKDSTYYSFLSQADSQLHQSNSPINSFYLNSFLFLAQSKQELNPKTSLEELQEVARLAKEHNMLKIYASAIGAQASLFYSLGLYDESLPLFLESIELFEKFKDWPAYAYALNDVGNLYYQQGMLDLAKEYFEKAKEGYKNFEKEEDKYYGFAVYENNIALIAIEEGDFNLAEKHFRKGLYFRKLAGRNNLLSDSYIYLGRLKNAMDQKDSCMYYLHLAMVTDSALNLIHEQIHSTRTYAYYLVRITGEQEKSLKYYKRALYLSKKYKVYENTALIYLGIGGYYARKYQADSANYYGWLADSIAKVQNQKNIRKSTLKFLKENYAYLNDYLNYSKVLENIIDLNQNNNEINDDKALKAQIRFEVKKRKKEEELRKKEKRSNSIIIFLLISLLCLLISYAILLIRSRNRVKLNEKRLDQALKQEKLLKEHQTEMTNMIIHDLKSPLNVIINCKTIFQSNEDLDLIQHAGYQMDNLVMNILEVYKSEVSEVVPNTEECDFIDLISSSVAQLNYFAKSKNISIEYPKTIQCIVAADRDMIIRVLANLLSNAVKFSPKNQRIWFELKKIETSTIKVSVFNNGSSIPPENQELIFKRFKSSGDKPKHGVKSTGLGLTYCKIAVEAHGGEIGLFSEPDTPVEFWFTLPNVIEYNTQ